MTQREIEQLRDAERLIRLAIECTSSVSIWEMSAAADNLAEIAKRGERQREYERLNRGMADPRQ